MNLKGKTILVTGGALRIGRSFVERFQSMGADVIVHYNNSEEEAKLLSPFIVQADLSDPSSCTELINKCGKSIDILINNASLFTKDSLKESFPDRVLKEFRVNLFSPLELIRQFSSQTKNGCIINILDRRIDSHDTSCVPYSITKQGLAELTRLAAIELAPNIRVNGVAPGPILPPPNIELSKYKESAGKIPLVKMPTKEEVVDAGCYLINNHSITGQILYVDGGQHLLGNGV